MTYRTKPRRMYKAPAIAWQGDWRSRPWSRAVDELFWEAFRLHEARRAFAESWWDALRRWVTR
jgi:hypothetical protein